MDKNTIWAIVLSTVVIVASYLLLPRFFPGMRPENMVSQQTENAETNDVEELSLENNESPAQTGSVFGSRLPPPGEWSRDHHKRSAPYPPLAYPTSSAARRSPDWLSAHAAAGSRYGRR